jgi:hypothetical protein
VIRTRHTGGNWWIFECKDIDKKEDVTFSFQILGILEVLDKASTMIDRSALARVAVLFGSLLLMTTIKAGDGNPFDEIWEAIYDLQGQVQSLNETIQTMKTQIARKPKIITTYNGTHRIIEEPLKEWTDWILIPNVTVPQGANVLALFSVHMLGSDGYLLFSFRANTTRSEYHKNTYVTGWDTVEIHTIWMNMTSGVYTFGVLYYLHEGYMYVDEARLTLVIF